MEKNKHKEISCREHCVSNKNLYRKPDVSTNNVVRKPAVSTNNVVRKPAVSTNNVVRKPAVSTNNVVRKPDVSTNNVVRKPDVFTSFKKSYKFTKARKQNSCKQNIIKEHFSRFHLGLARFEVMPSLMTL